MVRKAGSLVAAVAIALLTQMVPALAAAAEPLRSDLRDARWELNGEGAEPRPGMSETATGTTEDAASRGKIVGLAWLAGCWRGEAGEECWLAPRGGMMLGVNRGPDRPGRPPFFELLRVVEDEEGLVLLAQPGGQAPAVPFRAIEIGDSRVVFANPEHDFPQRITYWREGAALTARVEALQGGKWQGFEQGWSRGVWPGE